VASVQAIYDIFAHLSSLERIMIGRQCEARMTIEPAAALRSHTGPERERLRREAALDETIEQSFPASDPPSTDPNPDSDPEKYSEANQRGN
jgi:hypothetical protein